MTRTPARLVLGIAALAVGTLLAARYGFDTPAAGLSAFLVAAYGAAVLLRSLPRGAALLLALLAGGAGAWVALSVHADLRGEKPDTGPDPTVARDATGIVFRTPSSFWRLPDEGDALRLRATAPATGAFTSGDRVRVENLRTAPAPPEDARARVLVWGDCRSGITVFEHLCDEIRRRNPDFTVGLGDLVGMARTYQFEILDRKLEATGVPTFVVPGNHDLDPFGTLRPYARVFGPLHWSFEWKGALWAGLDTARGVLDPKEVAWLEEVLAGRGKAVAHVVLCFHHPLWMPAARDEKPLPEDDATKRLRAIAEREKAIVLCSHFHGYDLRQVGAVTQLTTGGAGARLEDEGPHHCVWMTLGPEGAKFERIDLMEKRDVSPRADRLKTFLDEGAYASRAFPARVPLAMLAAALFLGGIVGAAVPRQRRKSALEGTTA